MFTESILFARTQYLPASISWRALSRRSYVVSASLALLPSVSFSFTPTKSIGTASILTYYPKVPSPPTTMATSGSSGEHKKPAD
jgi:hypothetical protein